MNSLIRLVFFTHWSVPAVLALLVGYGGWWFDGDMRAETEARHQIAAQPLPAVMVDIEKFVPVGSSRVPVEVNLRGQWLYKHNTALDRTKSGKVVETDFLFVLASADDSQTAQAAIVVDEKDKDAALNLLSGQNRGYGTEGPLVEINGIRTNSLKSSHVEKALNDQHLKMDDDFFYIEPFLEGRDVAMAKMAKATSVSLLSNPFLWLALILAGVAALKVLPGRSLRRR